MHIYVRDALFIHSKVVMAEPGGRAVQDVVLKTPVGGIVRSNPAEGLGFCSSMSVAGCVGIGLCDELITRSGSPTVCVCACARLFLCVTYKPQHWDGLGPIWAVAPQRNVVTFLVCCTESFNDTLVLFCSFERSERSQV